MKVMLITLPKEGQTKDFTTPSFYSSNPVRYIPLGILAVATSISPDHDIRILDADSYGLSIDYTVRRINEFAPDVLGISAVTRKAFAMSKILKRANVSLKVVGGPHVTHYAKETINLGADATFKHDSDRNFNEWLNTGCKRGIYEDYIRNIDSLPFIRREFSGFELEDYMLSGEDTQKTLFKQKSLRRLAMMSSKGCPFRCVFCDVQDKEFRFLSPQRVVDEMEHLLSCGANSIHILDDCFNTDSNRVIKVCEEIKKRGLKFQWSCRGRAVLDRTTAEALQSAGCVRMHVGIESLNPEVLKWMNKRITVETTGEFCDLCNEYGIEIVAYFVLGAPMETREYREKLPDMIRELKIKYPFFNILYPSANTKYYRELMANGTYKMDYWQAFAEKPVPNFEIPLPRSEELQDELEKTAERCIKIFFNGG
ncbi:B12-binding domain-containing radical SAM protein [Patescibacteria group bacterium]|nr:B12-binding domain-containing radical SAM protein [Patescibacteria group bacterium]